jgi:hypothetical protein
VKNPFVPDHGPTCSSIPHIVKGKPSFTKYCTIFLCTLSSAFNKNW